MKAVVAAFNQEKALVGAFSVLTNLRMEFFQALIINIERYPKFAHFELIGPEGHHAGFDAARAETDHRDADEGNRPEVAINHDSFEVFF